MPDRGAVASERSSAGGASDAVGMTEVVYVLLLMQAGLGLLAALGELVVMANPLYLIMPLVKATVLFVLAAQVVRGRRWALVTLLVVESAGLLGVLLSLLAGLLPVLDRTVTLTGLLTEIALPIGLIYLCVRLLAAPRPTAPHAHALVGVPR